MSIQKVITDNGGEILTARMMRENMALVHEEWHQRGEQLKYHAIMLNPREAHELAEFIRANVPGYPPAPIQADVQDGDNPPPKAESKGVAGDLDRQPAE